MKYRSDIDGLRAIAILFVLSFHGGLSLFPSGFIGVDIFFVISGFLITGLIHDSLQKNNFSFAEFYKRRLWRLQPVFICLLVFTALITLLFYLPEDLVLYFKSARKASLFMSNNFFERATSNYFATANSELPLLHTWSLSVEWQCYLILPVFIFLLYKLLDTRYFIKAIYLLTLLFLGWTLYRSAFYPEKTYYQLLSRIFEFLIGSCVALNQNRFVLNKFWGNVSGIIAVIVLVWIAMQHNVQPGFPNWYALVLCIATAALIIAGQSKTESLATRFLSLQPMVFIGLISYSLYIWHWPIFVLMRYMSVDETTPILLFAFALVFIVAWLSWRFIEKPTRQFNSMRFSYSLVCLLLVPVLLFHFGDKLIKKNEGYPQRFVEAQKIDQQLKKYDSVQRAACLQEKNIDVSADCRFGAKNKSSKTAFMIGDSYGNHYWRFMDILAQKANLSVIAHATAACLSLPGINQYDWNKKVYSACHEQTRRYFNMIKHNHYDYVIIGENWNGYLGYRLIIKAKDDAQYGELAKKQIEQSLDKALQVIIASGSIPVLIKTIALDNINPHTCFYDHIKRRKEYIPAYCDFVLESEGQKWQDDLFSRMKNKYAQLIIIEPQKAQCPNGQCMADLNGIPIFRDAGHIYDYAAYHLGKMYLMKYKNPLIA